MPVTIAEIKVMLANAGPMANCGTCVDSGPLIAVSGKEVEYKLFLGWDLAAANSCDETWGVFNVRLMRFIRDQNYDEAALSTVLATVQLDDSHWRWLDKSAVFLAEEYKWFFLMAEGYPQAACLIYHPKPSAFDDQGVFYIEYVAVAPWNRENPMAERSFKGVGKLVVQKVSEYAIDKLGLRPGFSLHALPRAAGFYAAIGMQNFASLDKGTLQYFEMPETKCLELIA